MAKGDPPENIPGEPHPGFENGAVADLSPGYIPGEPDEGFANGSLIDSHATNSLVVGSSNADPVQPDADEFDPADHTVEEVVAHVADHPDDLDRVLVAEKAGKARVTLLGVLDPAAADEA